MLGRRAAVRSAYRAGPQCRRRIPCSIPGEKALSRHRAVAFRAFVQNGPSPWAVPLPFDPVNRWSTPARPLWKCGRGHRVHGSLNGQPFKGVVVERAGAFWLLLEESWADDQGLQPGQSVEVLIEPEHP